MHAAHLRVLLGTLTLSGETIVPTYSVTADQVRVPVTNWIRSQKLSDGVIDFDATVRDPNDPAGSTRPTTARTTCTSPPPATTSSPRPSRSTSSRRQPALAQLTLSGTPAPIDAARAAGTKCSTTST